MKKTITKFDLSAAFKALDEIEVPKADKGICANRLNLKETLNRKNKTDILLEDYYDVNDQNDMEQASEDREGEVAKAKLARVEKIIDLDAKSPEDLLPSYAGKIIIQCPQCMQMLYKNEADIQHDKEDETLCNVGEPCQVCGNTSGYTIIGKVAPVTDDEMAEYTGEETPAEGEEGAATEEEAGGETEEGTEDLDLDLDNEGGEETEEAAPEAEEGNEDFDELDLDLDSDEEEDEDEEKKESLNTAKAAPSKFASTENSTNTTLYESAQDEDDYRGKDIADALIQLKKRGHAEFWDLTGSKKAEEVVRLAKERYGLDVTYTNDDGYVEAVVAKEEKTKVAESVNDTDNAASADTENAAENETLNEGPIHAVKQKFGSTGVVNKWLHKAKGKIIVDTGTNKFTIAFTDDGTATVTDKNGNTQKATGDNTFAKEINKHGAEALDYIFKVAKNNSKSNRIVTVYINGGSLGSDLGLNTDKKLIIYQNNKEIWSCLDKVAADIKANMGAEFTETPAAPDATGSPDEESEEAKEGADSTKKIELSDEDRAAFTRYINLSTIKASANPNTQKLVAAIKKVLGVTESLNLSNALADAENGSDLKTDIESDNKSLIESATDDVQKVNSALAQLKTIGTININDLASVLNNDITEAKTNKVKKAVQDVVINTIDSGMMTGLGLGKILMGIYKQDQSKLAAGIVVAGLGISLACLVDAIKHLKAAKKEEAAKDIQNLKSSMGETKFNEFKKEVSNTADKTKKESLDCSINEEVITEDDNVSEAEFNELADTELRKPVSDSQIENIFAKEKANAEDEEANESFDLESLDNVDEDTVESCIEESLKNVYSNVNSYTLTECKLNSKKQLVVEGLIVFKSGNTKATTYTFTEAKISRESHGTAKLTGLNESLTGKANGKFVLEALITNNTLRAKNMSYAYSINDSLVSGKTK